MKNNHIIAITGPSGAGKTTLSHQLEKINYIGIPMHCTTRKKRDDDEKNFYRYFTHEDYNNLFQQNAFIISSGDSNIIKKEYGNFYGLLYKDCDYIWKDYPSLIALVSYKDLSRLLYLKENGYKINIVNLTFENIERGVEKRISTPERNITDIEIYKRIRCAIDYEKRFGEAIKQYADSVIYTDKIGIEDMTKKVIKDLRL